MRTTINKLPEGVIGISLALLGSIGNFRYGPLACNKIMFLSASELKQHFKKITTSESVNSCVSCAKKYFDDKGTGTEQLQFFWYSAARYGRMEVMQWVHEQGYSDVRNQDYIGIQTYTKAAKFGQLQALQWLRENGCDWNRNICYSAAGEGGHLPCLQWAEEKGCDWNKETLPCAQLIPIGICKSRAIVIQAVL